MKITAVLGDITDQHVDAIVNAANRGMRGGGGVDGAIHRAGGPEVLRECIERFPDGLATGDAGWTTAGDLPARWIIHAVGPNHAAGQRDRSLLESCYRRALQVADDLGARTVAFPLISTGIYAWPEHDAVDAAVHAVAEARTDVDEVRIVAFTERLLDLVGSALAADNPMTILRAVRLLHQRGYHRLRVMPGMSASGMHWRIALSMSTRVTDTPGPAGAPQEGVGIHYTTADLTRFGGAEITLATPVDDVAQLILATMPQLVADAGDAEYVAWYAAMLDRCERRGALPVAYSDAYNPPPGWEIGWGSGVTCPNPPA